VVREGTNETQFQAIADAKGEAIFHLERDNYVIKVLKQGFFMYMQTEVSINADKSETIILEVAPEVWVQQ